MTTVEDGRRNKTVGYRAERLAALLGTVKEGDVRRADLAASLDIALNGDVDPGAVSRSDVAWLLVRGGLQSAFTEIIGDLGEVRAALACWSL
jgi:hypothetical protein